MPSSEAQVSDDGAFGVGQVHVRGPPRDRVSEMGPHHIAIEGAQEHFDEMIDDTDIPRIRPRAPQDRGRLRHVIRPMTTCCVRPVDHVWAVVSEEHVRRMQIEMEQRRSGTDGSKLSRRLDDVQPLMESGEKARMPVDLGEIPLEDLEHRRCVDPLHDDVPPFGGEDLGDRITVRARRAHRDQLMPADGVCPEAAEYAAVAGRVHVRIAAPRDELALLGYAFTT